MAHIPTVYGTYIPSGAHIYGYGKWCSWGTWATQCLGV
jgi:hypothetical protein